MDKRYYYNRLTKELNENFKEYTALKAEYDQLTADRKSGKYSDNYLKEKVYPRQFELKRQMERVQDKAYSDVNTLTEEMRSYLRGLDALNPEELTDDTKLLNSGIKLTKNDIQSILDRNSGNRTMTQLALRYAKENSIEGLEHTYYVSAESKMESFDNIKGATKVVIRNFDSVDGYNRIYGKILGEGTDIYNFAFSD